MYVWKVGIIMTCSFGDSVVYYGDTQAVLECWFLVLSAAGQSEVGQPPIGLQVRMQDRFQQEQAQA